MESFLRHTAKNNDKNFFTMETNDNFYPMPRIGDSAPAFKAETTKGPISFPEDFKGCWVILFSHPGDFTPVCTSEFMIFGDMYRQFKERNCELLGLSVGSIGSHIAWLRTIKEKIEYRGIKNLTIQFPLIEDLSMEISRSYGMIQPAQSTTKTVRTVFFIDPKGIVRASINYPMVLGRNMQEIMRVLVGLQTIDKYSVALPADWQEGDEVITAAGGTFENANRHMDNPSDGEKCYDWFFCIKKLPVGEKEEKKRQTVAVE